MHIDPILKKRLNLPGEIKIIGKNVSANNKNKQPSMKKVPAA